MANYVYPFIGLIGGTAGFLDAIDGTALADLDMAYGSVGGITYTYLLDVDSAAAEASPNIIAPDANGGDKRWILQGTVPAWTTPTFDAANFTGDASMTWTVEAGDVTTYAYIITGKTMTVAFWIGTSTVGGTPSTDLRIKIPASKTATKTILTTAQFSDNGGAITVGHAYVTAGGTNILNHKIDDSNWTAATNTTMVRGQITFEIN